MTSLERIKELVDLEKRGDGPIEHDDGVFLLKAFEVMREIAINNYDLSHSICADADECRCEGIADKAIDQKFAERMSKCV